MLTSNKKIKGKKNKFKWSVGSVIVFTIFVLYTVSLLGSYFWIFLSSLKEKYEYARDCLSLPKDWLFSNYSRAFRVLKVDRDVTFFTLTFNSIWMSISRPTIAIVTQTMASYAMSKYKFPGRRLIWTIIIFQMVIPIYGGGASAFVLYKKLNWYDNPLFVLSSVTGLGGSLMIISAFDGVSKTYMEAGFIEGAGHFRVFFNIMVPQIAGLLAALWIMSFVSHWNDYMTSLTYMPSYKTLATGLYTFQKINERKLDYPILFAGALICMIPSLILFLLFQDKFINISFGGGIKG